MASWGIDMSVYMQVATDLKAMSHVRRCLVEPKLKCQDGETVQ